MVEPTHLQKYARQIASSPQVIRDENKTSLSCHHLEPQGKPIFWGGGDLITPVFSSCSSHLERPFRWSLFRFPSGPRGPRVFCCHAAARTLSPNGHGDHGHVQGRLCTHVLGHLTWGLFVDGEWSGLHSLGQHFFGATKPGFILCYATLLYSA